MSIEIKFDPDQPYQRAAIDSVVSLFTGQEAAGDDAGLSGSFVDDSLAQRTPEGELNFSETIFGNRLLLAPESLRANLERVQDQPVLAPDGSTKPLVPVAERAAIPEGESPLDFSVEMETGTGKTYVYIRTIAELHQKYGWSKFVIVVPSVAIREGVMASLRSLRRHVAELYEGLAYTPYLYNSARLGGVRAFATSPGLQIMVINIDAFASAKTIMNKPVESMGYRKPIEFVRACRPVVVMDEPQNMESGPRQEAVASLWPLLKIGYSATHKDLRHLVYRLTPVDAYDLRLVKRIGVLSITKDEDRNDAHVEVTKIQATPNGVTAAARIFKAGKLGTKLTQVRLRKDDDLCELSGGRTVYSGWVVEEISAGEGGRPGVVEFGNGRRLREGVGTENAVEQHQRLMIRHAVESHFEKELQLRLQLRRGLLAAPVKPLALFFIDRVANYHPPDSKFRQWFEQEYEFIRSDARFRSIDMPDVSVVHDGYFATSAKGEPKDISSDRDSKDAESAFERIMQNKERLLGFDEPLRFIFSHSALVEGWDSPNVFTICNLQDGKSEMRKRQQIGRGLRLPVMSNGERCRVDDINLLTVIAHEEFSTFADKLQKEIEDETGVRFTGRITNLKKDKIRIALDEQALSNPTFLGLWERISRRTTYRLTFETDDVVRDAVSRINGMGSLEPIKFRVSKTEVDVSAKGLTGSRGRSRDSIDVAGRRRLPDVIGELSRRVPLSRATIVRILERIDNLDQVKVNPSLFIDNVETSMNEALYNQLARGVTYKPLGDDRWPIELFTTSHQDETVVTSQFVVPVTKSVTDRVVCDSKIEVAFAEYLEKRQDVSLFLKLPHWFKIPTPLGNYNPDWALVRTDRDGNNAYLVRETKGTGVIEDLRWESEGWKIKFGQAHFDALSVDYFFHHDPEVLIEVAPELGSHDAGRRVSRGPAQR